MALSDFLSGAKDMLDKAKHLVEETTGIDVDNAIAHPEDLMNKAKDAFAHPEALMEQAKAKGTELFSQFTGSTAAEKVVAVDPTEIAKVNDTDEADEEEEIDEKTVNATAKTDGVEDSDEANEAEAEEKVTNKKP